MSDSTTSPSSTRRKPGWGFLIAIGLILVSAGVIPALVVNGYKPDDLMNIFKNRKFDRYKEDIQPYLNSVELVKADFENNVSAEKLAEDLAIADAEQAKFSRNSVDIFWSELQLRSSLFAFHMLKLNPSTLETPSEKESNNEHRAEAIADLNKCEELLKQDQ